jgi:hypothetical protein
MFLSKQRKYEKILIKNPPWGWEIQMWDGLVQSFSGARLLDIVQAEAAVGRVRGRGRAFEAVGVDAHDEGLDETCGRGRRRARIWRGSGWRSG